MIFTTPAGCGTSSEWEIIALPHPQSQMKKNKPTAVLALVLFAVAGFLVWRQMAGPRVNLKPSAAVGEVLAEECARLLGGNGTLVLIARAPDRNASDANSERIAAFQAAMNLRKSPQLAAVEWLPRPPRGQMDTGGVNEEQLVALVDQHPKATAFLIFAGLPPFSPETMQKFAGRSLKLVVVCGYSANLKRLLESKTVALAVVPRFSDLPAGTPAAKTSKDWFDQEFEILTPETVGRAPY